MVSLIFDRLCFLLLAAQFDALGNTGGCQATYTVILPLSTPNCTNVTYPPLLGVEATVDNGPMSQFGWVDQVSYQNHPLEVVMMYWQVH